ncbi:MAG: prolyl oligopeptidase family serine peptidase [Gemmatimonadota bacterium]
MDRTTSHTLSAVGTLSTLLVMSAASSLTTPLAAQTAAPPATRSAMPAPGRLTLDRYMDLEGVGDPRISPDGSRIVYGREWIDPMTDSRKSSLWIMNADGSRSRYLTDGTSPRWSPSGDRIAFLACGTAGGDRSALLECDDGSRRQIYVRYMDAEGAVTQVTRLTQSASNIAWSPDGERIAFNMLVPREHRWEVKLPRKPRGAKWTAEPRIIERLDYRQDRRGFEPQGHRHIFTVPATGGTPRQITDGEFDHGAPAWAPDGRTLYFSGLRREDADWIWRESEVYAVDVATREIKQLTHRRGPDSGPLASPDGRLVAYTGVDSVRNTYITNKLYVMNADGSNPHALTADLDRTPRGARWSPRGDGLFFVTQDRGTMNLWFVSLDGRLRQVTRGNHQFRLSSLSRGGVGVGTLSSPTVPEDVYAVDLRSGGLRRLTEVNADLLADISLGEVEEIEYGSVDDFRIQGWIVKPPDFDPSRKYPLILHIHGGPHAMYGVNFSYSFQNFAAEDHVVLYLNPRGSSGYGTEFGNAIMNAYPGKDYDDLMAGVDELLSRGYVDEENMLVTGCSGGGVLSSWVVGHTERFAAAVVRCPVTDWFSFVGTTDSPNWYRNFAKLPWEDPSEHLRRSSLMYVGNVSTPTLLMTGVKDLRTPMPQTEEFYQALKFRKVPSAMIRMQEEWHGTSSKPSNFLRTQAYIMHWFEKYMTDDMRARRKEWREERGSPPSTVADEADEGGR